MGLKLLYNKIWLWIGLAILLLIVSGLGWFVFKDLPPSSIPLSSTQNNKPHNTQTYQLKLITLPADDAPHDLQTEWWYYNGHLKTETGRYFSFHYVVFLDNALLTLTAVHISITDHQSGRRYTEQLRTGGNPSVGTKDGFNFVLGNWEMSRSNGHNALKVQSADFMFDLELTDGDATVFHGGTGLLNFKKAGSSYYYSRTRMPTMGTIKLDGKPFSVSGISWFDHQWGDFQATQINWNWFSLQLDDGADIMLYELRDVEGNTVLNSGTYTNNESTIKLIDSDFATESLSTWTSKVTGITYPAEWRVSIPGHDINIMLSPWHQESEFDGRMTTHNAYWEGAVKISGSHTGKGFVELGGYKLKVPK